MSDFESAPSWSVNYQGIAYDDARNVDGVWMFRSPVERNVQRFLLQDHVVPLFENPTISIPSNGAQSLPCEARERLILVYLAAINRHAELSKTVPLKNNQQRRLATEGSRAECEDAMYELNQHRKEHGC